MKQGWEVRKLGDVCDFVNGDRGTNYPSKSHRTETGIPFINAGHLTPNGLDLESMDYISRERFNLLGSGKIKKDDILFCLRGSLGKFAKVQEFTEGAIASSLVIVRPNQKIISNFLMYYFESKICADMIKDFGNGAAQPNLSAGSLRQFEIPLPPLPEQQRIVAILDEAFAAIAQAKANAEQNLQNAKELFESYLQSVFENKGEGWEEKTLGEVCELISGQHIDAKDYNFLNQGIGYLTGPSDFGPLNPVITKWTEKPKIKAQSGDILITVKGSGVGKVNILNQNEIAISRQLMAIRVTKASKAFIYAILSIKNEYFRELSTGAAIPGISRLQVLGLPIFIPSLSEQQAIVEKLDALSTETKQLEVIYQQKINDLDELKKSILQKAFAGELNTSALELEV